MLDECIEMGFRSADHQKMTSMGLGSQKGQPRLGIQPLFGDKPVFCPRLSFSLLIPEQRLDTEPRANQPPPPPKKSRGVKKVKEAK